MQVVSNIALITINETLLIQLVSFLIFLFVINRVMFRPLQEVMGERSEHMEKLKRGILESRQEVENLNRTIRKQENRVKSEALSLKDKIEASAEAEASKIFEATRKEIEEQRKKTEEHVQAELSEARKHIRREAGRIAVTLMEKALNRRIAS
jgi:F-type H+-transporting ATPase subunit b